MSKRIKTVKRFAVWNGTGKDAWLHTSFYDSMADARKFVAEMPAYYRSLGEEKEAIEWEETEHPIVPVDVPTDDLDLRDERREVEEYSAQTRRDSEEHETADAIIAEMRNEFNKSWHDIAREWAHDLADRLEAAIRYERERLRKEMEGLKADLKAAHEERIRYAVKMRKEMDEAAEHINAYLNEIPINRVPHDWLIRNGYKDESYQSSLFDDKENGK